MSRLLRAAVVVALAGVSTLPSAAPAAVSYAQPGDLAVIVQAPGSERAVAAAVVDLGGTVTTALPIVSGFAASIPANAVGTVAALEGVRAVTPDIAMHATARPPGGGGGGGGSGGGGANSGGKSQPKSVYAAEVGSTTLTSQGGTGQGVTVALVDTGVSTTASTTGDLAGKVLAVANPGVDLLGQPLPGTVPCVNFSGEATCDDTYGHGTFLAGLIAGSGAASGGRYRGVAPDARIVSVKVGGADGSADVSKVLAGIQWVVSFADTYDIGVLNLSLGSDSTQSPSVDPLNLAVQRAWVEGVTVVVSAGNLGAGPRENTSYGTITKPGDDPFVITVGAVDDRETTKPSDDRLPAFSSWGPTAHGEAKPDVVAPGARLVSLRAPGSTVDAVPAGVVDATYRRGSGTSMAAAVVSGLSAQLLDLRSGWRPDDVKDALMAGAIDVASDEPRAVGDGLAHGPNALNATISPTYETSPISNGSGSLADSSGTTLVSCGLALLGCGALEGNTSQGNNWQGTAYATTQWTPQSWYESQWATGVSGNNWQATTWAAGNNWQGNNWQGASYYGEPESRTYGTPIPGSAFYGAWG